MSYDNFRVTGAHDTVFLIMRIYSLSLFETIIFRNSIQDGMKFFLNMSKIPSDDVLESLYKLRTRESDQLKTV